MIGIVGAGMSGLALAVELRARGVPFRILEAEGRPGGVVRSVPLAGRILELGPQRVRPVPEVRSHLARVPGWADGDSSGNSATGSRDGVWIARHGALHPVPRNLREGWESRLLSPMGKLRLALEPFVPGTPADPARTSAEYLRRRAGDEAYRALFGPLFGGLYGSLPDEMDAGRALLPALRELGADRSLLAGMLTRSRGRTGLLAAPPMVPPGGMEALPRAMAAVVEDALSLGVAVKAIEPGGERRWCLVTHDGGVEVDAVVVTTPPAAAAALLASVAPDAAEHLRSLRMNHLILVHLVLDPLPPGLGFQVAYGERSALRGMTFSGHLDGSGSTAVAFLGGLPRGEDDELAALAVSEAARWTGARIEPLLVSRTHMPAWDRTFRALDALRLPPGIHLHANYVGRPGIVGRVREAGPLADRLWCQRAGSQEQEGSAARGSPVRA